MVKASVSYNYGLMKPDYRWKCETGQFVTADPDFVRLGTR